MYDSGFLHKILDADIYFFAQGMTFISVGRFIPIGASTMYVEIFRAGQDLVPPPHFHSRLTYHSRGASQAGAAVHVGTVDYRCVARKKSQYRGLVAVPVSLATVHAHKQMPVEASQQISL